MVTRPASVSVISYRTRKTAKVARTNVSPAAMTGRIAAANITAGDQNSNACIRMDDSMNENWGQQFIDYNLYYNSNGTRIVYGAYGAGEKPILQGSVARSRPEEWSEIKPGLWTTQAFEPKVLEEDEKMDRSTCKIGHVALSFPFGNRLFMFPYRNSRSPLIFNFPKCLRPWVWQTPLIGNGRIFQAWTVTRIGSISVR